MLAMNLYYNPGSTTNLASATIKKIDEPGCNVYGLKWATKLPPFFAEEIPLTQLIGVRTDPAIFLIVAIDEIVRGCSFHACKNVNVSIKAKNWFLCCYET